MNRETIIYGNKLINEFTGLNKTNFIPNQYHSSWDWLMFACNKWDNLNPGKGHIKQYCELSEELDNNVTLYDIDYAFEKLIKCIEWLNSVSKF